MVTFHLRQQGSRVGFHLRQCGQARHNVAAVVSHRQAGRLRIYFGCGRLEESPASYDSA